MKFGSRKVVKWIELAVLIGLVVGALGCGVAGSYLTRRYDSVVKAPGDIETENISFQSGSGATIRGWEIPGAGNRHRGTIVLLHGVRSDRSGMLGRARFLSAAGYTTLLFDFQAEGESSGSKITYGYLEGKDVEAAVKFVLDRRPNEKIGVIGASLGGAAALTAGDKIGARAMVLEMVFSNLEDATANRFAMVLGDWGRCLTPLLTMQLKPRIGVGLEEFDMLAKAKEMKTPKLFIAGSKDRHTLLKDSLALFEAAARPKDLWVIEGANHCDLREFTREEYDKRTLAFFEECMKGE